MKIILVDPKQALVDAWREAFQEFPQSLAEIEFHTGGIFDLPTDAVVSPANSFGFMNGGLDGVLTAHFGSVVQQRVQSLIRSQYGGELLVGQAIVVDTTNDDIPFVVAAPTMRIPTKLPEDTIAPYLATRAVIRMAKSVHEIQTISMAGMGTGVGEVPLQLCAKQMCQGIMDGFVPKPFPSTIGTAWLQQKALFL